MSSFILEVITVHISLLSFRYSSFDNVHLKPPKKLTPGQPLVMRILAGITLQVVSPTSWTPENSAEERFDHLSIDMKAPKSQTSARTASQTYPSRDSEAAKSDTSSAAGAKMTLRQGVFGRSWGYYMVDFVLKAIWMITPFSLLGLGYCLYLLINQHLVTPLPIIATVRCASEVVSAVYQRYLILKARRYVPICVLSPEERDRVWEDVFHGDLRPTVQGKRAGGLEVIVEEDESGAEAGAEEKDELVGGQPAVQIRRADQRERCLSLCCSGGTDHDMTRRGREKARLFRKKYSTWFNNAPWEDLRRDNVLAWIAMALYNLPLADVLSNPESRTVLLKTYLVIEARSATTFPPGYSPSIKVIRLFLDPLNAAPRPLFLYVVPNVVNWVIRTAYLPLKGMKLYRQGEVDYMLRIPRGWTSEAGRTDPNAMPLMYLHGMGFGLIQNIKAVKPLLERFKFHPLLFPIAHHTAQSIFNPDLLRPWTRKPFVKDFQAICDRWGFGPEAGGDGKYEQGGLSVMSHSNGSVHHSWLLKDCPQLIRRSTFVDPIVFCLDEGFTCHAFIYRQPRTASFTFAASRKDMANKQPFELLMKRLVSSELGISYYIQRHFHWSDNSLLIDEHPDLLDPTKTQYFLGKKDVIVDAPRVREYLERYGVEVGVNLTWDEDGGHSQALQGDCVRHVQGFMGTGVRYWT